MRSRSRWRFVFLVAFHVTAIVLVCLPALVRSTGTARFAWIAAIVTILLYGTLGAIALRFRPDDVRVRLFVMLGYVVTLTMLFDAVELRLEATRAALMTFAAYITVQLVCAALIVHICAVIPRPCRLLERRWVLPLLYGTAVATAGVLTAMFRLAAVADPSHPAAQRFGIALSLTIRILFSAAGVAGLWLLARAARRETEVTGRRQALIVFAGLFVWTADVVPLVVLGDAWDESVVHAILQPASILLVAVCFFVAVVRFRLFDVAVVIRRSLIYAVTAGLIVGVLFALVQAAALFIESIAGVDRTWAGALFLIAAGAAFHPLATLVGRAIDQRFFREKMALEELDRAIIPELARCGSVEEVAQHAAVRLRTALDVRNVAVLLVDAGGSVGRVAGWSSTAATQHAPQVFVDAEQIDAWSGQRQLPSAGQTALESLEAVTLVRLGATDEALGGIALGPALHGHELDGDDLARLRNIAQQAAAMIENTRLRDLARTDPLTGLPRRHVGTDAVEAEIARYRRAGHPFAVALADIDDFKAVNDRYGHAAGDLVLATVGGALRRWSRSIDVVARYGGEEFIAVMPETDRAGAVAHLDRLRETIATLPIAGAGDGAVTISVGVRCVGCQADLAPPSELLADADRALYAAKRAGKNRVVANGD